MSIGLYGTLLAIQTSRHRGYFADESAGEGAAEPAAHHGPTPGPVPLHALLLLAYLVPVVLLAKKLAMPIDYGIEVLGLPAPGRIHRRRAGPDAGGGGGRPLANHLQRAVKIFLGSVLATIGLTVPAVLGISLFTGRTVELGLQGADPILLVTTLLTAVVTFSAQRT
jgi:Ca2+:H+ antiporter